MKAHLLSIASVLALAAALVVIFSYGHGTVGFNVALPVAGSSFTIGNTTTGWTALGGFALIVLAFVLLLLTFFASIAALFRPRRAPAQPAKAAEPVPAPEATKQPGPVK